MTDINIWNIDTSLLIDYKNNGWVDDYFIETKDGKYGIHIYNIEEWRMSSYAGIFALFKDRQDSKPLLNSPNNWVWFNNDKTIIYAPLSDCLIFRMPAYQKKSKRPDFPFIIIKPKEQKFGFIEWDATSIYYTFKEQEKNILIIQELYPAELKLLKKSKPDKDFFDLKDINWFDIKLLKNAIGIYHSMPF
jgi:hypothetical protein